MPVTNYNLFLPETCLALLGLAVLMLDLVLPRRARLVTATVAGVGLLACLWPLARLYWVGPALEFTNSFATDPLALFFKALFIVAGVLVVLLSTDFFRGLKYGYGEYFSLIVFLVLGMCLLASSNDIITFYLSFEMVSLTSYILTGYLRKDRKSNEAALKYFLYGAAASGVMLYGLSLAYGLGRSTNIEIIGRNLAGEHPLLGGLSMVLVLAGLGYKISMVPFHAWTPDVYEGAPTPVTAFLSVGPKAAGFAILMRLVWVLEPGLVKQWPAILAALSALTMGVGNLLAIRQANIKRMLAYSSIAHAGYLLIGVVVGPDNPLALKGVLVYFAAYLLMNLGAFAVAIAIARNSGSDDIRDFAGLAKTAPVAAVAMTIFLLSLTGIPPTAGFLGKFYLFMGAIQSGTWAWLAVVAIINSAVSLYYYMNVVRLMWFGAEGEEAPAPTVWPAGVRVVLWVTLIGTLALGLFPGGFLDLLNATTWTLAGL
jgi:NADH-quinone oxidoreductase subunit N